MDTGGPVKLREKEYRVQLCLDDVIPVLSFLVQYTAAQRHVTGIVDQDADVAQFAFDPSKGRSGCGTIREIDLHCDRRNADGIQFREHMLILVIVASKDCDGSPSFGQADSNAATNPTITTGHNCHLPGQVKERRHLHFSIPRFRCSCGISALGAGP
jgi:hypothetical protein